jgi:alpha-glucosidase
MFGTRRLDALTAEAHRLGLKVMIDEVLSHTPTTIQGSRELLSRTNPRRLVCLADAKPDGTPPNNWLSIFGGSAGRDTSRQQYYLA